MHEAPQVRQRVGRHRGQIRARAGRLEDDGPTQERDRVGEGAPIDRRPPALIGAAAGAGSSDKFGLGEPRDSSRPRRYWRLQLPNKEKITKRRRIRTPRVVLGTAATKSAEIRQAAKGLREMHRAVFARRRYGHTTSDGPGSSGNEHLNACRDEYVNGLRALRTRRWSCRQGQGTSWAALRSRRTAARQQGDLPQPAAASQRPGPGPHRDGAAVERTRASGRQRQGH